MLQSFYPLLFYGPLQFYGLVRDAPTIIRGPLHRGLAVGGAEGFWCRGIWLVGPPNDYYEAL